MLIMGHPPDSMAFADPTDDGYESASSSLSLFGSSVGSVESPRGMSPVVLDVIHCSPKTPLAASSQKTAPSSTTTLVASPSPSPSSAPPPPPSSQRSHGIAIALEDHENYEPVSKRTRRRAVKRKAPPTTSYIEEDAALVNTLSHQQKKQPPSTTTSITTTRTTTTATKRSRQTTKYTEDQKKNLHTKNKQLKRDVWELENENSWLRAQVMTQDEIVGQTEALADKLDHANKYIGALKKQVRALGGSVFDVNNSDREDDETEDGDVGLYVPDAVANPHEYTMPAMLRRRYVKRQKKRGLWLN